MFKRLKIRTEIIVLPVMAALAFIVIPFINTYPGNYNHAIPVEQDTGVLVENNEKGIARITCSKTNKKQRRLSPGYDQEYLLK